jgi:hypothetical protein
MNKFAIVYLMMISISSVAGEIAPDFNRLVESYGQEYLVLRTQLLDNVETRNYILTLLQDKEVPAVKRAQALILQEWMDDKRAIREILAAQVIDHTPKRLDNTDMPPTPPGGLPPPKWNTPRGGFRYPSWHSLPTDKLDTLMKVYNTNPCPWFILECLWKFNLGSRCSYGEAELVVKPFEDIPKYTHHNPLYVFFGMARSLPEEQKMLFVAVLERKILKVDASHQSSEKGLDAIEQLLFICLEQSSKTILNWIRKHDQNEKVLYMRQFIPMIAYKSNLAELKDFIISELDGMSNLAPEDFEAFSKNLLWELLDSLQKEDAVDDNWINIYLKIQSHLYPLAFYEDFIYRIRPDLRGRLIEDREGGYRRVIIAEEKKQRE